MKKRTKKIKAWIILPPDVEKLSIGSLIFCTKQEAENQKRENEKVIECEIILKDKK